MRHSGTNVLTIYSENAMISSYHLVYTGTWIKQIKYIVMINKERSSKIVIFMTRGAGVIILGRGNISHYSEYVFSLFSAL